MVRLIAVLLVLAAVFMGCSFEWTDDREASDRVGVTPPAAFMATRDAEATRYMLQLRPITDTPGPGQIAATEGTEDAASVVNGTASKTDSSTPEAAATGPPTPTAPEIRLIPEGTPANVGIPKVTVRMSDVDDRASLYINGVLEFESAWGYEGTDPDWRAIGHMPGDSGEIDITSYLEPGVNTLRITLWNKEVCCYISLSIAIQVDGVVVFSHSLAEDDSSEGIKYDETITVTTD